MEINWQDKHHSELSAKQLYAVLALRCAVFIVEQTCPYLDVDGQDMTADNRHILGMRCDELVAYARILTPADDAAPVAIGRVIVSASARGLNLGNRLMEQALLSCEQHWPEREVYLSAQAHLQNFYGRLGFQAVGDIYLEDNIPHIDMRK